MVGLGLGLKEVAIISLIIIGMPYYSPRIVISGGDAKITTVQKGVCIPYS